jgi:hypothetical protein
LISESLEGVRVAATRQKAGRLANTGLAAVFVAPAADGRKAPGSIFAAEVIFTFWSETEARLSQEAAITGEPLQK